MADGLADPCVPPSPDDVSSGLLDITRLSVDSRPSEGEKAMEINWEWKGRESLSLEVRRYSADQYDGWAVAELCEGGEEILTNLEDTEVEIPDG